MVDHFEENNENSHNSKTESYVEECSKNCIEPRRVITRRWQNYIHSSLELVEAEAVGGKSKHKQPNATSNELDDLNQKQNDNFATIVRIVIFIRIVLEVPIEIQNEKNHDTHAKDGQKDNVVDSGALGV